MNRKILLYMVLINLLPFLLYDRLIYHSLSSVDNAFLFYLFTNFISKMIIFILIYCFIQIILFKILIMRLYNQNHVSAYAS
jgi:hypothetical protein